MTPEEQARINAVTAKLAPDLWIGARVRYTDPMKCVSRSVGSVISIAVGAGACKYHVQWDNMISGSIYLYKREELVLE